jgi:hypothetical protein
MSRKRSRNRPRGQANDKPGAKPAAAASDQYSKYLPEWMRDGTPVPRPPRPRRARQQRSPGGYTPGKFAITDPLQ